MGMECEREAAGTSRREEGKKRRENERSESAMGQESGRRTGSCYTKREMYFRTVNRSLKYYAIYFVN